jgi:hypothetical protein
MHAYKEARIRCYTTRATLPKQVTHLKVAYFAVGNMSFVKGCAQEATVKAVAT